MKTTSTVQEWAMVRLPAELHAELKAMASAEHRTIGKTLRLIIQAEKERRGLVTAQQRPQRKESVK